MRVLFCTVAAPTHLHTQVPLAWALRAAGHDVRVASQPDLVTEITATGLTAVPVGRALDLGQWVQEEPVEASDAVEEQDFVWGPQGEPPWDLLDFCEQRPERLTYEYMQAVLTAWTFLDFQQSSSAETIDDLVAFAHAWRPDLVIWDPLTFAGPVAATASGAAHGRLLFGFDVLARMRQTYLRTLDRRPPARREDPLREWLEPVLARYGCRFSEEAVFGRFTVDPVPASLRLPVEHRYVPMRYVPYNGAAVVPEWLRRQPERRRVCLTLGRSFRELLGGDRASVTELLEAVAGIDVEVVATLDAAQVAAAGTLPDNVRAVPFVPLDVLLPTCAAIVHHSGSGTVQTALAHGVPQVVVPALMFDNLTKAQQIQHAGAGLYLQAGHPGTAARLREALVRVLNEPSFTASAQALRREMRAAPTPAQLVPTLCRLAGR